VLEADRLDLVELPEALEPPDPLELLDTEDLELLELRLPAPAKAIFPDNTTAIARSTETPGFE
jgi:hypothetical protein